MPSAQRNESGCHLAEATCCTWVRPKHGKPLAIHLSCHAAFAQLCRCRPFRAVQPCDAATCLPSSISSSAQLLMLLSGRKNSVRGTDFFLLAILAGGIKARDQSQDCTRKAAGQRVRLLPEHLDSQCSRRFAQIQPSTRGRSRPLRQQTYDAADLNTLVNCCEPPSERCSSSWVQ